MILIKKYRANITSYDGGNHRMSKVKVFDEPPTKDQLKAMWEDTRMVGHTATMTVEDIYVHGGYTEEEKAQQREEHKRLYGKYPRTVN